MNFFDEVVQGVLGPLLGLHPVPVTRTSTRAAISRHGLLLPRVVRIEERGVSGHVLERRAAVMGAECDAGRGGGGGGGGGVFWFFVYVLYMWVYLYFYFFLVFFFFF